VIIPNASDTLLQIVKAGMEVSLKNRDSGIEVNCLIKSDSGTYSATSLGKHNEIPLALHTAFTELQKVISKR